MRGTPLKSWRLAGCRAVVLGAPMVTVEADPVRVESRLAAGGIGCPNCRVGVLGGWGYARVRHVEGLSDPVRPRRARCRASVLDVDFVRGVDLRRTFARCDSERLPRAGFGMVSTERCLLNF